MTSSSCSSISSNSSSSTKTREQFIDKKKLLDEIVLLGVRFTLRGSEGDMEDYSCPICYDLMKKPVMHPSCGNMFCYSCAEKLDSCPLCREALSGINSFVQAPKLIQNRISDVHVRCDLCKTEMSRSAFDEHSKHCSFPCPFDCGQKVSLTTIKEHCFNGSCSGFEVSCPASEPPLSCSWRGPGGSAFDQHLKTCQLAKLIPYVKQTDQRIARLEETVERLNSAIQQLQSSNGSQLKERGTDAHEEEEEEAFELDFDDLFS